MAVEDPVSIEDKAPKTKRGGRNGNVVPPAPKGNVYAIKHGMYAYRAVIEGRGIDQRSSLYRALREKEKELVTSLGGDPSPQEQTIINDSIKVMLYIGSLDNYLMTLKSLVRKGRPHPVLAIRTQLSAHLRENLKTLGLKRIAKTIGVDTIKARYESADDATGNSTDE